MNTSEIIKAVKELAVKNYEKGYGWQVIVECYTDKEIEEELEFQGEIKFQSVDEIVLDQLKNIESDTFDNSVLIEIYNRL